MKTLDTRTLNERLDELEAKCDALTEARDSLNDAKTARHYENREEGDTEHLDKGIEDAQARVDHAEIDFDESEQEELTELESLRDEISEWKDGATLVAERDFEEYARQLAEDLGAISEESSWPCNCIDWARAADELKMDYSEVTYQGTTYLYRS